MFSNAKLSKSFWVKSASTTCFLINRSPLVAIDKKTVPLIEVRYGTLVVYFVIVSL